VTPPPLVEVALPVPVFHPFTYRMQGGRTVPAAGTRVLVPFRRRESVGWVLGPAPADAADGIRGIRSVLDVLEDEPSAPGGILELALWMSEYYATPPGIVLRSILPAVLSDPGRDVLLRTGRTPPSDLPVAEARVLRAVEEAGGRGTVRGLRGKMGPGSPWPAIRGLTAAGLLVHEPEPPREPSVRTRKVVRVVEPAPDLLAREGIFGRAHRQRECLEFLEASAGRRELGLVTSTDGFSRGVVTGLEDKGLVEVVDEEQYRDPFEGRPEPGPPPALDPTPAQREAIDALVAGLDDPSVRPFLLHGITGSGKTLVYIELLREVVDRRGRTAIVLVPEIALTPQTVERFRAWFGDRVAVLHSGLSDGERYDAWRALRTGEKRIVVGARSALFAPLPDLGAIVVDEEHDGSYKQSEAPRYHGRDLAVMRALRAGAVCVLGSATPSLESWRNATRGKFTRLSLPDRVGGGALPPVEVVDLRKLREGADGSGKAGPPTILSPRLVEAVHARLERGEQSILLLNRRGYASFVQCRACGEVGACPNCSVSLTLHRARMRLVCHHCRHEEPVPPRCPRCGDPELSWRGLGTEQVERVVAETFPAARLARMDVDTTGGKWAHAEILGRVARREVDLLLGTQMIAKGLDFPNVTLVGIVNADVGLHLPDFRASERTFQLLSQVAGRAGRGPAGVRWSSRPRYRSTTRSVRPGPRLRGLRRPRDRGAACPRVPAPPSPRERRRELARPRAGGGRGGGLRGLVASGHGVRPRPRGPGPGPHRTAAWPLAVALLSSRRGRSSGVDRPPRFCRGGGTPLRRRAGFAVDRDPVALL
jgi:primosomal protein N' (replication factor Y) (superfamily II helicase)